MKIDHKESYIDFGKQFLTDKDIDGYWGSVELLKKIVHPFDLDLIKNKKILDIGIGSGRISKNLLKYEPSKLVAVEPSDAIKVAQNNIKSDKIEFLNIKGQDINFKSEFDYIFALCVIHHIPEYKEVLKRIQKSLKTDGRFVAWVYGKEGMELYNLMLKNLRRITSIMPDFMLRIFSQFLAVLTYPYGFLCKFLPLPLKKYFTTMACTNLTKGRGLDCSRISGGVKFIYFSVYDNFARADWAYSSGTEGEIDTINFQSSTIYRYTVPRGSTTANETITGSVNSTYNNNKKEII